MKHFTAADARAIDATKYLYIRAGDAHGFVFIWVVVVDGRVLVRPWNNKATSWYRAFLENPRGAIKVGEREVPVRARPVKSAKLFDAMDVAYAEKYDSKANQKYVTGFSTTKRRATTLELVPR